MNITIKPSDDTTIILIDGRIDTLTATEFETACLPLITAASPNITIDCNKVDYISSTGLRVFILADKKCVAYNGQVTIANLTPFLKNIFDISGLTYFFNFV